MAPRILDPWAQVVIGSGLVRPEADRSAVVKPEIQASVGLLAQALEAADAPQVVSPTVVVLAEGPEVGFPEDFVGDSRAVKAEEDTEEDAVNANGHGGWSVDWGGWQVRKSPFGRQNLCLTPSCFLCRNPRSVSFVPGSRALRDLIRFCPPNKRLVILWRVIFFSADNEDGGCATLWGSTIPLSPEKATKDPNSGLQEQGGYRCYCGGPFLTRE